MWNKRRLMYHLWLCKVMFLSYFKKKSIYRNLRRLKHVKINVYNDIVSLTELNFPIINYNGFYSVVNNLQGLIFSEDEKVLELLPNQGYFFLSIRDWYLVDKRPILNDKTLFQDFIKLSLEFYYYFDILTKTTDTTKHHYRIRLLSSFKVGLDNLINDLSILILK